MLFRGKCADFAFAIDWAHCRSERTRALATSIYRLSNGLLVNRVTVDLLTDKSIRTYF